MTFRFTQHKILYVLIIGLFSCTLTSQSISIRDSITDVLKDYKSQDSIRIKKLVNVSNSIINIDPSLSLELAEEALELSTAMPWNKGIALSLRQKGVVHYSISDNINALKAFQDALRQNYTSTDNNFKASLYNNIGNIHADIEQYDIALKNYEELLKVALAENHIQNQIIALTNIGTINNELANYDAAILNLNKALGIAKKINSDYFIGAISNNLGIPYKRQGDYEQGQFYYKKAYDYGAKTGNKYLRSTAANNLSEIELIYKNYDATIMYAKESLVLSTEIGAVEWQSDSWDLLYKAYEALHQNDKALEAYKKHSVLNDSIYGKEITSEIVRKEAEFEAEKQQAIEKSKQEKQALIKKLLIIGIIVFIIVSALIFIFYKRKQKAISISREAQFKARVSELELKALKAQMNPHFLFNGLTSVGKYILENDTDSANDYLTKYASLMRQTLESSTKELISLDNEIVLLRTYLDIEKKRLQNRFSYVISVKDEVETDITLVPPLMLQPFIENSIIHGISTMKKGGLITLEFSETNNKLLCVVEDNGIGREASKNKSKYKKESFGINITKNRIDLMNKNAQNNIKIIDKDSGTRVEVSLPLELDL